MFTRKVIMTFEALRLAAGNSSRTTAATAKILLVDREDGFLFINSIGVSKFAIDKC